MIHKVGSLVFCLLIFQASLFSQTGNTGIGTTNPQAKLHVNGDLRLQQGVSINKFSTDSLFSSNSHSIIPTEKAIKDYIKTGLWMGVDTAAVSDNIIVAKGFESTGTLTGPVAAAIQGNYAYVANYSSNELAVVDISDHNKPLLVSGTTINLSGPIDVEVQGNYVFVLSELNNRLCVFNISNPLNPTAIGFTSSTLNDPVEMTIQGNFMYVANNASPRVQIFDISNPLAITTRGFFTFGFGFVTDIVVQGNFAYVTYNNSRFSIFDISNPDAPVARGSLISGIIGAGGVYVRNGFAYVSSPFSSVVKVLNVSNPDAVSIVGTSTTEMKAPYNLAGVGNYLLVTDQDGTGIGVFDISSPPAISWKAFNNTNLNIAGKISVSGETLAVPSFHNNRLCVFELDRTRNLTFTSGGFVATPTSWSNYGSNIYRPSGNVGIGISQPTANLHVEGKTYLVGQVGINTDNPQQLLHVEGDSYFNGSLGIGTTAPLANLHVQGNQYVSGNIGIGTATPLANLHVQGNQYVSGNIGIGISSPSNLLSFAALGGKKISLFPGATGDAGMGIFPNEFRQYSDNPNADITFGYDSYSTGFSEKVRFKASGMVGVGTSTPTLSTGTSGMVVQNSTYIQMRVQSSASAAGLEFKPSTGNQYEIQADNSNNWFVYNRNANAYRLFIAGSGNVGIGTIAPSQALHVIGNILASGTITPSDIRYKRNIKQLQSPIDKLQQLNGVTYDFRKEEFPEMGFPDKEQIGLIAQEVEKIFPQLVVTDDKGYKAVDYVKLVPVLIEALKETHEELKGEQQQLKDALKRIDKLEILLTQIIEKK